MNKCQECGEPTFEDNLICYNCEKKNGIADMMNEMFPKTLSEDDLKEIDLLKYPNLKGKHWIRTLQNAKREAFVNGYGFRKQETIYASNPSVSHICQLLRDIMRTFNNLNVDNCLLVDRIKETMRMYANEAESQQYRLTQSEKENEAWEKQREAMFNASKKP